MAHRTQILLEDSQYEKLQERARRESRGLGELVREAVAGYLGEPQAASDAVLGVIGLGAGDGAPVARNHDDYLYAPEAASKETGPGTRVRRHQRVVRRSR